MYFSIFQKQNHGCKFLLELTALKTTKNELKKDVWSKFSYFDRILHVLRNTYHLHISIVCYEFISIKEISLSQ